MTRRLSLSLAALTVLVAACGGGGGGASPAPVSAAPAPSPASAPGTPYAAGSPQASALQEINSARAQCGFSTLTQAAELDKSSAAHASYMTLNGAYGHEEVQGKPGFTGVEFSQRETAAGYDWVFAGEVLAQMNTGSTGADAMRALLAAPYHAALLLNSFRDIGIAWGDVSGLPTLTADLGTRAGQSLPQPSGVVTYPCAGITDAVAVAGAESPSPFPSNPSASWGQPVIVRGPSDLALTGASITGPSGSVAILATYGSGQTADPNNTGDFTGGWFAIIPATLQPGTTYTVSLTYTTGGAAASRNFSFSTGR